MSPDEARERYASARCLRLLRERYAQYAEAPPDGPVLEVAVQRWSGWAA
jgi:hypothetical protein